jgi:hypothetical protein
VAGPTTQALRLAQALRDLRKSTWEDRTLTQAELAKVLSRDGRVATPTLASWESTTNPKLPPPEKLRLYALLFATPRSVADNEPRILAERDLTPQERTEFSALEANLLELRAAVRLPGASSGATLVAQYTWEFHTGPITIICPEPPEAERSPLASETNPNYTRLYRYADLDALIELYGHLRATNPQLEVFHRLPSEVKADDLSGHLVLLGGVAWNDVTRRFLKALAHVPIRQFSEDDAAAGEIFATSKESGRQTYRPVLETGVDGSELLVEDVALLVRVPNPYNSDRTLTICNGAYSRGVLGAVRSLTDAVVRDRNEAYLATRFDGSFAILMRVPVVQGEALTPDLENASSRLYEWPAPVESAR